MFSPQALSALSSHAASLTNKLEACLKQQETIFKKMKQTKSKDVKGNTGSVEEENASPGKAHGSGKYQRDPLDSSWMPQHLEESHCLIVARGLVCLLLEMDHSCSADMFLLSCKVISHFIYYFIFENFNVFF